MIDYINSIDWDRTISALGLMLTLVGLWLTYRQAKNARLSADEVKRQVAAFSLKRAKSEALTLLGEAKAAMEVVAVLVIAEKWRDASSVYDDARKSLQKALSISTELKTPSVKKLKVISEHLMAFSNSVDNAIAGKDDFPDQSTVRAAIRQNSDDITFVQREIHEGLN